MIDSHHHFWTYKPADFPWIGEGVEELLRDYKVAEFEDDLEFSGIDQVISVQARRTDRENRFLIDQAKKSDDLVAGIVGWAPLDSTDLRVFLDQYIHEPLLKGVREMIAGTPTERFLDNPDFDQGILELTQQDLAFDLFISEDQLPAAIAFADRHPNQRMVLNHCGCPKISAGSFSKTWARHIRELARRPHVYCKISGLTAEVQSGRSSTDILRPYFDTALESFGPERLMYGSDWPVCKLTTTYPAWLNIVDDLIITLSNDEKDAIHQQTAIGFYKI
ncbi:MAG: amidohydrolase family protein [Verrucomicrobiae bacterium]|nr:amidohydrolase family protein [Verrucomicrobiae bacterium]NNJ86334.1 amidohydrolase family protein [Akkermansiaceae bacterium]